MQGHGLWFVAALAAAVHVAVGCSSDKGHEPFANATCTHPPCGVPVVTSGGQPPGAGGTSADGGLAPDASAAGCFVEMTSGLTLCDSTPLCPGFLLDQTLFPSCGFVKSSSVLDLECPCLPNLLCPISVMSTCAIMMNQVANSQRQDALCMSASNATCRDVNGVLPTGTGGAGNCNQACLMTCSNTPACVAGCCTNP